VTLHRIGLDDDVLVDVAGALRWGVVVGLGDPGIVGTLIDGAIHRVRADAVRAVCPYHPGMAVHPEQGQGQRDTPPVTSTTPCGAR